MKEQELSEKKSELERSKSALARLARAAKQTNGPVTAAPVAPAPNSFRDLKLPPAVAELGRQNSLARLRSIYDALLTQLNLSPEQRKRFYELHSQGMTPDSEKELREMFGPRGYQFYQTYVDTERERTLLREFRQQVDAKSLQIADWQYDRLLDAVVQARKQSPQNTGGIADSYDAALVQAAQFLTPEQLEAARNYFHNQAEVLRAHEKMMPPGK